MGLVLRYVKCTVIDPCVPDSSIQCQDHSTTPCYGKDEGNIPWGCQLYMKPNSVNTHEIPYQIFL